MINKLSTGEGYRQLYNARNTKAGRIMGIDKVGLNTFIKNHATAKVNAKFGGSRFTYTVNGLTAAAAAISIGNVVNDDDDDDIDDGGDGDNDDDELNKKRLCISPIDFTSQELIIRCHRAVLIKP